MRSSFGRKCFLSAVIFIGVATVHAQRPDPFQTIVKNLFPELGPQIDELPRKCGTPMFVLATQHWQEFSTLAKSDLQLSFQRPVKQKSRLTPTGHLRVHYDTTGLATPALLNPSNQAIPNSYEAYVDSASKYLDYAWKLIVDSLGYAAPPGDGTEGGGPEYDVYLDELEAGKSGFTAWDPGKPLPGGPSQRFAAYSVLDNDFLFVRMKGMDGLKITAAHEFFHGVQVGSDGIWTTIANSDFYFYELSSVWMEDVAHTNVNDYLYDLPPYFQSYTDIQGHNYSFTIFTPTYQGYERAIWAHYLTKRFGVTLLRSVWEEMRLNPFLTAIDRALANVGTNFVEEYATFARWNFYTGNRADTVQYYPEGRSYPQLKANAVQAYNGFSTASVRFEAYPFSSQLYVFVTGNDSIHSIVSNVDIARAREYSFITSPFELRISSSLPTIPYQSLKNGLNVGFSASNLADWRTLNFSTSTRTDANMNDQPSPNPVRVTEVARISLPVNSTSADAEVFLFSSSLDLRYSGKYPINDYLGKRYVFLPTQDIGGKVATGVYFLVVECPDAEYRWKIVFIQ